MEMKKVLMEMEKALSLGGRWEVLSSLLQATGVSSVMES